MGVFNEVTEDQAPTPTDTNLYGGSGGQAADSWGKWQKKFGNIKINPTDYESNVTSGYYLDLDNNKYAQQYADAIKQNLGESFQRTSSQALSPFASMNNMFSGVNAATQARIADESTQNQANTLAEMFSGIYGDERNRQQQIADVLSGRQQAQWGVAGQAYGSDQQRAAMENAARMAAEASMYGSDQSLEAALAHARASMYGSDQSLEGMLANAAASRYGSGASAGAARYAAMLGNQLGMGRLGLDTRMFDEMQKPLGYYNSLTGTMGQYGQNTGTGGGSGIPSWVYGMMGGQGGGKMGSGL